MNQAKKDQMDRLDPFLLEYFKYLREEINLRIVKHSRLLIYKLIAVLGLALVFFILMISLMAALSFKFKIQRIISNFCASTLIVTPFTNTNTKYKYFRDV